MKIDRRQFLATAGTALATAATAEAGGTAHFEGWPDAYGMLTDTTLCIGENCRKCEQACKKANNRELTDLDLTDNSVFDKRRRTDANNFTVVNRFDNPKDPDSPYYVKQQCMHCKEPACASACLVRAFTKTPEGPVIYNPDVCIGCRYCMVACPFYIPAYDYFDAYHPEVRKCTMCFARLNEGKRPACADICPKEALTFGKRSDLIKLAREKIRDHPGRYIDHIYGEHEVGGTNWLYLAGTDFAGLGFQTDLGVTPYPELTRGFLSVVPLVLTIWPVLLTGFYKFSKSRDQQKDEKTDQAERRG